MKWSQSLHNVQSNRDLCHHLTCSPDSFHWKSEHLIARQGRAVLFEAYKVLTATDNVNSDDYFLSHKDDGTRDHKWELKNKFCTYIRKHLFMERIINAQNCLWAKLLRQKVSVSFKKQLVVIHGEIDY